MRTGFAIAAVAGILKKVWILLFGVVMLIGSVIQYYIINYNLNHDKKIGIEFIEYSPLIYLCLSLGLLYIQFHKNIRLRNN